MIQKKPFRLFYSMIHSSYHALVPRKFRIAFWEFRWSLTHKIPERATIFPAFQSPKILQRTGTKNNKHICRGAKNNKHIFIFAMVPYHDIGGGQRAAQLAKTFNKMGYLVHYIYAFESSDAGKKVNHFSMERHIPLKALTPKELVSSLRGEPIFIFEAPYKEFEPFLELAQKIRAKVIYEHIDNWETSLGSFFYSPDILKQFLKKADVIIATAQTLKDKLDDFIKQNEELLQCNGEVIYAANAVDTDLFEPLFEQQLPQDMVRGSRTLLYYGSLWGEWFDWGLLRHLAEKCEDCAINIIGDHTPIPTIVKTMPSNVHFLGPRLQGELPAYLRHCDIAILPFKSDQIGRYVSPLKVFEYIGMDKPVLSTNLPDIQGYPNVYASDEADDWVRFVKSELPAVTGQGPTFARRNNWYARCNYMLNLLEPPQQVPEKEAISIIVLNRNNGDVITRCIDSLIEYRDRYQYEIIVVDNQSTDGSYELLKEQYSSSIVLLRNIKNGCSSGRNRGIKQAKGCLVLFLDSDQWVVSERWLEAPLEALRSNRSVGAVGWAGGWFHRRRIGGPITNHLADGAINAATLFRTDIGYLGSDGMLVRREVLEATGGFDENYDPTCYEDTDLSLQIRDLGYELAYCPYMDLTHLPHQTTLAGSDSYLQLMQRNGTYFLNKWQARNRQLLRYYYVPMTGDNARRIK